MQPKGKVIGWYFTTEINPQEQSSLKSCLNNISNGTERKHVVLS